MKINPKAGFQKFNPGISQMDTIPPIVLETKAEKKKRLAEESRIDIADKVMRGEKLTKSEKRTIHVSLTGKEPPKGRKRGRRSNEYRDLRIAVEYIGSKAEGGVRANKIKQELEGYYGLSGQDPTFYKALNKGIEQLEYYSELWLKEVEGGYTCEMDPDIVQHSTDTAIYNLQCIAKHREQSKHLKKRE